MFCPRLALPIMFCLGALFALPAFPQSVPPPDVKPGRV